jgi:alpha-N-arabinofuranosidase
MSVVKRTVLALAMLAAAPVLAAVTINSDPAKPGAVINKNVYGQFAEHLGTGICVTPWPRRGTSTSSMPMRAGSR